MATRKRTQTVRPTPVGKDVIYDRETQDFAAYLDGELIGYHATAQEAEAALDALVYERLTKTQTFAPATEEQISAALDLNAERRAADALRRDAEIAVARPMIDAGVDWDAAFAFAAATLDSRERRAQVRAEIEESAREADGAELAFEAHAADLDDEADWDAHDAKMCATCPCYATGTEQDACYEPAGPLCKRQQTSDAADLDAESICDECKRPVDAGNFGCFGLDGEDGAQVVFCADCYAAGIIEECAGDICPACGVITLEPDYETGASWCAECGTAHALKARTSDAEAADIKAEQRLQIQRVANAYAALGLGDVPTEDRPAALGWALRNEPDTTFLALAGMERDELDALAHAYAAHLGCDVRYVHRDWCFAPAMADAKMALNAFAADWDAAAHAARKAVLAEQSASLCARLGRMFIKEHDRARLDRLSTVLARAVFRADRRDPSRLDKYGDGDDAAAASVVLVPPPTPGPRTGGAVAEARGEALFGPRLLWAYSGRAADLTAQIALEQVA